MPNAEESPTQLKEKIQPTEGSVRSRVNSDEWETRVNLAATYRLMAEFGMVEMIANHYSARVPGARDEFLINPYGMLFEEITASSLIKLNTEGKVLLNETDYGVNRAGYVIHSAVYDAREDVNCVIHTHTLAGMAVSAMECGVLPIAQTSMRWARGLSYHEYKGVVTDQVEKEELVRDLGDTDGMILRNHGFLVVGKSIPECFNGHYRLERACQVQVMALSCGQQLSLPPDDVVQATYEMFQPKNGSRPLGLLEWPSLLRKLDRIDQSYRL